MEDFTAGATHDQPTRRQSSIDPPFDARVRQLVADWGAEKSPELIEETLLPEAQKRLGRSRQQMLATMVMLGLNRIVVKDGSISARLRFRADAADHAKVDYAVSDDPGGGDSSWGACGASGNAVAIQNVPVDKVRDWEGRLLKYVHSNHQAFGDTFATKRELTKEIEPELRRVMGLFNEAYLAGEAPDPR